MESLQEELVPLASLRRALAHAEGSKTFCAIALSKDHHEALLFVDYKTKARKLAEKLRHDAAGRIDVTSVHFGALIILPEALSTVQLQLTKRAPDAMLPLLGKLVKRAGYKEAVFAPGEFIEEEEGEGGQIKAPTQSRGMASVVDAGPEPVTIQQSPARPQVGRVRVLTGQGYASQQPPARSDTTSVQTLGRPTQPNSAAQIDALAVQQARAKRLLDRAKAIGAAYPQLLEPLKNAWSEVQRALEARADASAAIARFTAYLDEAEASAVLNGTADVEARSMGGDVAALSHAQSLWSKVSQQMRDKLDELKRVIIGTYKDEQDITKALSEKLVGADAAFEWLDARLSTSLAAATEASDPAAQHAAAQLSIAIAAEYKRAADANVMLWKLDANPFGIKTDFARVVDQTLTTVSALAKRV